MIAVKAYQKKKSRSDTGYALITEKNPVKVFWIDDKTGAIGVQEVATEIIYSWQHLPHERWIVEEIPISEYLLAVLGIQV